MHGSSADRAIAALSADPLTLAELEVACARYEKPSPNHSFFANLSAGFCDEPYDAGLVVIDLVARLVVVDSTYSSPGPTGEVCYHDGHRATDTWLRYHLARDWLFVSDRFQWSGLRHSDVGNAPHDRRSMLAPCFMADRCWRFVARETFAAYARRETTVAEGDTIKEIHAAWLLTPRDDLGSACPRDVALERHGHLTWDLQDQADTMVAAGRCPPGLEESSFAFRYGGFGTHELVQLYELVRELLWSCWERLVERRKPSPLLDGPAIAHGRRFSHERNPALESVRDEWLETPTRNVMDARRDPSSTASAPGSRKACPAMTRWSTPTAPVARCWPTCPARMFWHLDGCNMDDDFAFDIRHRTREEWERNNANGKNTTGVSMPNGRNANVWV